MKGRAWKFGNNTVVAASAVAGYIVSPENIT